MRNLLERLKPEHKERLHSIKLSYPNTYMDICNTLNKTAFYTEVKIGIAAEFCLHLDMPFTLSNFRNLFNEK